MDTKPHLELILQIRRALANITYLQTEPLLRQDKDAKNMIWEEKEMYTALREKLLALPVENDEATFENEIDSLHLKR